MVRVTEILLGTSYKEHF